VAAPIVPPSAMAMVSAAKLMRAPAEMARLLTKATVRTRAWSKASRMSTAASTRPPKVLISRMTAATLALTASSRTRCTNGASPRSMMPAIGAI
jgi:hypothetical protein